MTFRSEVSEGSNGKHSEFWEPGSLWQLPSSAFVQGTGHCAQALGRLHLSDCHVIFTRLESFFWVFSNHLKIQNKRQAGVCRALTSSCSSYFTCSSSIGLKIFKTESGGKQRKKGKRAILLITGRFGISQIFMILHAAFFVSDTAETESQGCGNVDIGGKFLFEWLWRLVLRKDTWDIRKLWFQRKIFQNVWILDCWIIGFETTTTSIFC